MNQLIAIGNGTIGGEMKQMVNARELHEFLEVGKDFTSWMKVQIERARLVEDRDFVVFTQKGENLKGGRPTAEYHLTIDASKHVAMMSGTDKGFEVRDYFLECERRAKDPMYALNDPAAMRGLLLTYTEKVLAQQAEIDTLKPQAAIAHRICLADGSLCLIDAAKTLGLQPKKVFIPWLKANKWIYQRAGSDHAVAYQDKLQQMVLEHKVTTVTRGDGSEKISEQVLITPKGLARLADIFNIEAEAGLFDKAA